MVLVRSALIVAVASTQDGPTAIFTVGQPPLGVQESVETIESMLAGDDEPEGLKWGGE